MSKMTEIEKKVMKNSLELTLFRMEFILYKAKNAWSIWNLLETREHLQTLEQTLDDTAWPDEAKTNVGDFKENLHTLKKYVEEKDGTYGYASYRELERLFNVLKKAIRQY